MKPVLKPVLFNTPMVMALLDNRKTTTRRVIKPQPGKGAELISENLLPETVEAGAGAVFAWSDGTVVGAPYAVGDILYVRETWTKLYYVDEDGYTHYDQPMYYYAADGEPDITLIDPDGFEEDDQRIRWHPSIHMPKEAARIFLRVTDVRAERLQDITEEGARSEGIRECFTGIGERGFAVSPYSPSFYGSARGAFADLWNSTIPKHPNKFKSYPYRWKDNPWVWVIEFERCEKPEESEC